MPMVPGRVATSLAKPRPWMVPTSTCRHLCDLCHRGLLESIGTPLPVGGRPARLFVPTQFGLAVLAQRGSAATPLNRRPRWDGPLRLLRELPGLLGVYE